MKLAESELNQIIKEEIDTAIEEGWLDRVSAKAQGWEAGLSQRLKAKRKELGGKISGDPERQTGAAAAKKLRDSAAQVKKAKQTQVIIGNHLKRLKNDLDKLDLYNQAPVKAAISKLRDAVETALNAQPGSGVGEKAADFSPDVAKDNLLKQPFQFPGSK